ncbi:hypothetical protein PoB_005636100 [Plakobranchus ocellatus]|uniref:Uncharacterized protein n=1 Tax=Plakobranchus ocellatus TaxID=259542 RepID=A0AAV4CAV1_9GAST|nr:hypothetical protein PoB_005636100 [Plakobranchus ocellatus]
MGHCLENKSNKNHSSSSSSSNTTTTTTTTTTSTTTTTTTKQQSHRDFIVTSPTATAVIAKVVGGSLASELARNRWRRFCHVFQPGTNAYTCQGP